jgi:zinc D-Ala-D-Ala carboxypeptidase
VVGVDNKKLAEWIKENLEYDQLILEFYRDGEPDSGWVHVSWNSDKNRSNSLRASRDEELGKTVYKPW